MQESVSQNQRIVKITDEQLKAEILAGLSTKAIALKYGMSERNVQIRKSKLVKRGFSPEHHLTKPVPEGYLVRGVSTLYDKDGNPTLQWVKSIADRSKLEEFLSEAFQAMAKELPSISPKPAPTSNLDTDTLTCYPMGDPHFGALISPKICNRSYNLQEAKRLHCEAISFLVNNTPPSQHAAIITLGDTLHQDNLAAETPRSKHHLDVDGFYADAVEIVITSLRHCIDTALSKHQFVSVYCVKGNHDEVGSIWLAAALAESYRLEPRVTVHRSHSLFDYIEFGQCLIGLHHGHTCKMDRLPAVMATDMAEAWGRTKFRYWWIGHVHHQSVIEYPGVSVETFNTLAPNDAFSHNAGYRSKQTMKAITLHKDFGEISRISVNPLAFYQN